MPDFLGSDLDVKDRNLFGLLRNNQDLAQKAIALRQAGQDLVDRIGGGRLHPVTCIPGGMSKHLEYLDRLELLKAMVRGLQVAKMAVEKVKELYQHSQETFDTFARFPSLYLAMVKNGQVEFYDGELRVIDAAGETIRQFPAAKYLENLEERVDPKSYTKMVYLRGVGPENGSYRVAPLARLNVAKGFSTPLANAAYTEYRRICAGHPIEASLFYHYARMIELLYCVERASELLRDPEILSQDVRTPVQRKGGDGVGAVEAPRGTLLHHYTANEDGRVTAVNLVVSTAHNKTAMDYSVRWVAAAIVKDGVVDESRLNLVEMAIRCYDPCLSCSTHAYGQMPLEITLKNPDGTVRQVIHHGRRRA
jgi:coenzyme F420-reducing hydrogenase alpha subunit